MNISRRDSSLLSDGETMSAEGTIIWKWAKAGDAAARVRIKAVSKRGNIFTVFITGLSLSV
jgi:hypothetical protein